MEIKRAFFFQEGHNHQNAAIIVKTDKLTPEQAKKILERLNYNDTMILGFCANKPIRIVEISYSYNNNGAIMNIHYSSPHNHPQTFKENIESDLYFKERMIRIVFKSKEKK